MELVFRRRGRVRGSGRRCIVTEVRADLPAPPITEWEDTKNTLHLWAQIVGKVRMASSAPRNHW